MSEYIKGINFDNQSLRPADDGVLYQGLLSDGRLAGCGVSHSGTNVSIASGWLVIGGRLIRIVSTQTLPLSEEYSGYGMIAIQVDLTGTATESTFTQVGFDVRYSTSLDDLTLTQGNINAGSDTLYEACIGIFELANGNILSTQRTLPLAKTANIRTTQITIPSISSAGGSVDVTVPGVIADSDAQALVLTAAPTSVTNVSNFIDFGVYLSAQAANKVTVSARYASPQITGNLMIIDNTVGL